MPLGKGLSALIPTRSGQVPQKTIEKINIETLEETGEKISQIRVDQIQPNPDQPRRDFNHQEMEGLINSIREHGIIQPLILTLVRHSSSEGGETSENFYQIIAGERRYRAAKFLNLTTVPAIIRSVGELEKLELSLIENIQRQDLNPMERARAYQRLIDQFNLTQDEVAKKMGKNRATIANSLRLLTLPEII
ncbi:MAG: ParB/RepB/Spo0J family partition protein, partial [Patescibacteria group bacterium]